jgi:hypothetical protein
MEDEGKNWERALTTMLLALPKVVVVEYLGKNQGTLLCTGTRTVRGVVHCKLVHHLHSGLFFFFLNVM